MERSYIIIGLAIALFASCSTQEKDFQGPLQGDVFYASFEQPAEEGTKVYANENLHLRWNADDRVSIFDKVTYNQQYQFAGETGDNAGEFQLVNGNVFVTGNPISHVVSVYPYQKSTGITEDEVLTVTLPAEQTYAENTFAPGANTMVSVSSGNVLQYKNVGGYLMLKLYGEGISVSSITLRGNNGEKLAGEASVTMPLNGVPSVTMTENATTEITLTCPEPIVLGTTAEENTQLWFVVPPVTFEKGFSIIVKDISGNVFEKSTSKRISIKRNELSKMVPIAVALPEQLNNEIWYTTSDEKPVVIINDSFDANVVSNEYKYGKGIITFDADLTVIGDALAWLNTNLTSIILPYSIVSIGEWAFAYCFGLTSISLPVSLKSIGAWAFYGCESLASITLPDTISSIEEHTFWLCKNLSGIIIPDSVESIGAEAFRECSALKSVVLSGSLEAGAFYDCTNLIEITFSKHVTTIGSDAFHGCKSLTSLDVPDSVTSIGRQAFFGCSSLSSIIIPEIVSSIGSGAFANCPSLSFVTILAETPPSGEDNMFDKNSNYPIYVPAVSVDAYKTAQYWSDYADRIQAISKHITIDGDMSDWDNIETGVFSKDGPLLAFKATSDETYVYLYNKRERDDSLWGKGWYYFLFDSDSNPETGLMEVNGTSVRGIESWMYFYPLLGSAEAPEFASSPEGGGEPEGCYLNALCAGSLSVQNIIETEIRIPLKDVLLEKGQRVSIYSYGNRRASNLRDEAVVITIDS